MVLHAEGVPPGPWADGLRALPSGRASEVVASAECAVLHVTTALIRSGWWDTPAAEALFRRAVEGRLALVGLRRRAAPGEWLPVQVPLFPEEEAERVLAALRAGPVGAEGRVRRAAIADRLRTWSLYAARVRDGEAPDAVREALGLPSGRVPGAFWGSLRLLERCAEQGAGERWWAEDPDGGTALLFLPSRPFDAPVLEALRRWAEPSGVAPLGRVDPNGVAWTEIRTTLEGEAAEGLGTAAALLHVVAAGEVLERAHRRGLAHGALAPGWIGAGRAGVVLAGGGLSARGRTPEELVFVAPEQLPPEAPARPPGDVYSFAMLILFALYGEPLPYWALRDTGRLLREVDPEPRLAAVLGQASAWDPAARPGVTALLEALLASSQRVEDLVREALARGWLDQAERLLERSGSTDLRVELARRRAARGDVAGAVRALEEAVGRADDPAPIWLEMADLLRERSRRDAVRAAREAWERHRDRATGEAALRVLVASDEEEVARWADELLPLVDDDERRALVARVVDRLEAAGDLEGALAWLERGETDPRRRRDLLARLGDVDARIDGLLERGDQPALEEAFALALACDSDRRARVARALLAVAPDALEAARLLAREARERGALGEAVGYLERLCAQPGCGARDHLERASVLAEMGQLGRALEAVDRALELEPDHGAALWEGIGLAARTGRPAQAAAWASRWLRLHDDGSAQHIRLHLKVAGWFRRSGQRTQAEKHDRTVLCRAPGDAEAIWGLRCTEPHGDALDLPVGPHEAFASLIATFLELDRAVQMLSLEDDRSCDPCRRRWGIAVQVVDRLYGLGAIRPSTFELLFVRFPNWAEPVASVLAYWSGEEGLSAVEVMRWRGEIRGTRRKMLPAAHRFGPPRESFDLEALLVEAVADPPASAVSESVPSLVVGVGPDRRVVPLDGSQVLRPTDLPELPGLLQVIRGRSATYLRVDEGSLRRGTEHAAELRLQYGERVTWRGVALQLLGPGETLPDLPIFDGAEEPTDLREVEVVEPPTVEMERASLPPGWLVELDGRAHRLAVSPYRIGRVRDCELCLPDDPLLSRIHGRLVWEERGWVFVDEGSANGSWVNGERVRGPVPLREGDRLAVGRALYRYTALGPEEPTASDLLELEPDDDDTTPSGTHAALLGPVEVEHRVRVVNVALTMLARALDAVRGAGSARALFQQLVDTEPPSSVVRGLALQAPELPLGAVLTRCEVRGRGALEEDLERLLERARGQVCAVLPPDRREEVEALFAAMDVRRRLRAGSMVEDRRTR